MKIKIALMFIAFFLATIGFVCSVHLEKTHDTIGLGVVMFATGASIIGYGIKELCNIEDRMDRSIDRIHRSECEYRNLREREHINNTEFSDLRRLVINLSDRIRGIESSQPQEQEENTVNHHLSRFQDFLRHLRDACAARDPSLRNQYFSRVVEDVDRLPQIFRLQLATAIGDFIDPETEEESPPTMEQVDQLLNNPVGLRPGVYVTEMDTSETIPQRNSLEEEYFERERCEPTNSPS